MGAKKILLMILLILTVLLSAVSGLFWHMRHYVLVDWQFYPKSVQQLDLRNREISIRHYEKILRRMPGCEVFWNVPFQENAVPFDTEELTVSELTDRDIRTMQYFTHLETVHAEDCTDYESLLALQRQRPELKVAYNVRLGMETYSAEAEQIELTSVTAEDLALLLYLPNLQKVLCSGGQAEEVSRLEAYCREQQLELLISLGEALISPDAREVTAGAVTDEQLELLRFLPQMQKLHIRQPEASAQKLLELKQNRPEVTVSWDREVCGTVFSSETEEMDLSGAKISSLEDLEQELAYFPDLELVFLGECGLDNEELAVCRAKMRDQYKLVWTVSCGSKLKTRTDATTFMPVRENVYYFNDEEAYNLRYCEDMVCVDVGHMSIHDIDFVRYMPNLQYLILAHTQVQYIEPISSCKKLKFLELDWSPIRDLTPLKECTALEDLNLGNTFADFKPIEEMTWLKNLWMVGCSTGARYRMPQALPDTKVMVTGSATVANGWRDLENYYEMRDLLGMHYMSW